MAQPGDGFGFGLKAPEEFSAGEASGENHLHRDQPAQAILPGLEHDTHAAASDFLKQFVIGEGARQGHRTRSRREPAGWLRRAERLPGAQQAPGTQPPGRISW
jgi:hypothetical protein